MIVPMKTTTDYEFPVDWESMSAEEKNEWFKQERARRQAERQKKAGLYEMATDTFEVEQKLDGDTERADAE
jgi:hypothetical protein